MSTVPDAKTMPFKEACHQLELPHNSEVEEHHFRVLTDGLGVWGQSLPLTGMSPGAWILWPEQK